MTSNRTLIKQKFQLSAFSNNAILCILSAVRKEVERPSLNLFKPSIECNDSYTKMSSETLITKSVIKNPDIICIYAHEKRRKANRRKKTARLTRKPTRARDVYIRFVGSWSRRSSVEQFHRGLFLFSPSEKSCKTFSGNFTAR